MSAFLFPFSVCWASFGAVLSPILVAYLCRMQLANPLTPRIYTEMLGKVDMVLHQ